MLKRSNLSLTFSRRSTFAGMRLILYIEKFSENPPPNDNSFIKHLFIHLALGHPESEFIFIIRKKSNELNLKCPNILQLKVAPQTGNWLVRKWWFGIRLPSILKIHKPEIFISNGFYSSKISISQCLLVDDYTSETRTGKTLSRFLSPFKSVICFSNFIKNRLIKINGENFVNFKLIPPAAQEIFRPLTETVRKELKDNITAGREYFIYSGKLDFSKEIVDLLKAFSVFKKMQQSSMQLVLTGNMGTSFQKLLESLKTYKFRDAVLIKSFVSQEEATHLLGASYALLLPSKDGVGVKFLEAGQTGIPVISTNGSAVYELAGDAALYFNEGDHANLAAQMMYLYKDEDLRKRLIEKGKVVAAKYSFGNSARLLWQTFEDVLK